MTLEEKLAINVRSGAKLGFTTYDSNTSLGFKAYIVTKYPKTYGAHTAYGKRTVWKERSTFSLDGYFPTRPDAVKAARELIKKVQG
jgi:hypothetical protein